MIETGATWKSILDRIGAKPLRRGRGPCPFCDSRTGFSAHEEKGFHCFSCGRHGDKIGFVQQFHNCGFKEALAFFGIAPGKPPAIDPVITFRQKILKGLRTWAHNTQRKFRNEFYLRSKYELQGKRILHKNPEDPTGWEMLAIAYKGRPLEELETLLDLLIGMEEQQLTAYKMMRDTNNETSTRKST